MAILFVLAMACFVLALLFFLREVFLAVRTLRFGLPPEVRDPEGLERRGAAGRPLTRGP